MWLQWLADASPSFKKPGKCRQAGWPGVRNPSHSAHHYVFGLEDPSVYWSVPGSTVLNNYLTAPVTLIISIFYTNL